MERKGVKGWVLGTVLIAAALIAIAGSIVWQRVVAPVSVACDQEEEPDVHGNFVMRFDVKNVGRSAIAKLDFSIADTTLDGSPMGESSHYTLSANVAPGGAITRTEEVPQPPHYRTLKFSQIDCTLERVTFFDGSAWP